MGVNDHYFTSIIWHCISSSSTHILSNGESTGEFSPFKVLGKVIGLLPISLSFALTDILILFKWIWTKLCGNLFFYLEIGLPLHFFFADNLFIFVEATMNQVEIIKQCLNIFSSSSLQKISG